MTSPRVTTDVDVSAELMASGLTFSSLATDFRKEMNQPPNGRSS